MNPERIDALSDNRADGERISASRQIPFCVDLDGTLLRTDLFLESLVTFWRKHPSSFLLPFFWLLRGRSYLKTRLAETVDLDIALLPLRTDFVDYVRNEKAQGRRVYLATGAARSFAEKVAEHLGLFSGVFATGPEHNLTGVHKAAVLVDEFGHAGFDYAGNSSVDLPVWRAARQSILVNTPARLAHQASGSISIARVFPKKAPIRPYLKCLRVHQWLKNLLIFAPLIAAHQVGNLLYLGPALLAFISFSLCASGTYVLNDIFDLQADRRHAWKRNRPLASGDVPLQHGFLLASALFAAGIAIGLLVGPAFVFTLLLYVTTTFIYSFHLKTVPLLDVMILALFYTLRLFAGSAAVGISLSFWMLAFSMFLFLSLALSKRCAELHTLKASDVSRAAGRDYSVQDLECLRTMGICGGYAAVLVLALYINSPEVTLLYRTPSLLWISCPMALYWINWIWMKASRGELHEDPLVFALSDPTSYVVGLIAALSLALAV